MKKSVTYLILLATISLHSIFGQGQTLSPEDLKKKQEGVFYTGLPLINYSTDAGFGYGVRIYQFDNGLRTNSLFEQTPYLKRFYGQLFQTTKGQSYHEFNVDIPFIGGSQWRLTGNVLYNGVLNANYFGHGVNETDRPLTDKSGKTYNNLEDYQEFLNSVEEGNSNLKYNKYQRKRVSTRWLAAHNFNQNLAIVGGLEIGKTDIRDWQGEEFEDSEGNKVTANSTLFTEKKNDLTGAEGGWLNHLILGIKYDQRDFEPNPKKGLLAEYFVEWGSKGIGSDYDYWRQTASIRGFTSPLKGLTLGSRLALSQSAQDTPFYAQSSMSFFDGSQDALGGIRTLRGYLQERFIAPGLALLQLEGRYHLGEKVLWGQRFGLQPIAFYDMGNTYTQITDIFSEPRTDKIKSNWGGGVVIPWNLSTLIHIFNGYSDEGQSLSISFMHAF